MNDKLEDKSQTEKITATGKKLRFSRRKVLYCVFLLILALTAAFFIYKNRFSASMLGPNPYTGSKTYYGTLTKTPVYLGTDGEPALGREVDLPGVNISVTNGATTPPTGLGNVVSGGIFAKSIQDYIGCSLVFSGCKLSYGSFMIEKKDFNNPNSPAYNYSGPGVVGSAFTFSASGKGTPTDRNNPYPLKLRNALLYGKITGAFSATDTKTVCLFYQKPDLNKIMDCSGGSNYVATANVNNNGFYSFDSLKPGDVRTKATNNNIYLYLLWNGQFYSSVFNNPISFKDTAVPLTINRNDGKVTCACLSLLTDRILADSNLTFPSGNSEADMATCINSYIKQHYPSSYLNGHGADFVSAGEANNVNPALLVAIGNVESQLGTTGIATKGGYNYFGMTNTDLTNKKFGSVSEAIAYHGAYIRRHDLNNGLTTIDKIAVDYSPKGASNDPYDTNGTWSSQVKLTLKDIKSSCPTK